jgi:Ku70/Ku80 beta-barrel domain
MGEVQYVWANPDSPQQQVALSSLVEAMDRLNMYAIARWVTRDMSDAKMGVLAPCRFQNVDCLLWVQVLGQFAFHRRILIVCIRCLSPTMSESIRSYLYKT